MGFNWRRFVGGGKKVVRGSSAHEAPSMDEMSHLVKRFLDGPINERNNTSIFTADNIIQHAAIKEGLVDKGILETHKYPKEGIDSLLSEFDKVSTIGNALVLIFMNANRQEGVGVINNERYSDVFGNIADFYRDKVIPVFTDYRKGIAEGRNERASKEGPSSGVTTRLGDALVDYAGALSEYKDLEYRYRNMQKAFSWLQEEIGKLQERGTDEPEAGRGGR
jgi:hypothetical protein